MVSGRLLRRFDMAQPAHYPVDLAMQPQQFDGGAQIDFIIVARSNAWRFWLIMMTGACKAASI